MVHENTYKKIDFSGAKGLVFVDDKIITYRRDDKTNSNPLCIDLPGGGREGDESPFDTFKREVGEEFGIVLSIEDIKSSFMLTSLFNPSKKSYFFVTKPLKVTTSDIVLGNEGVEWLLMTPEEFITRPDGIKRQQERVASYLSGDMRSD